MKKACMLLSALVGAILLYVSADFPDWSEPNSPANTHVSPHYLTHSMPDTEVPNVVSSVLADYRGFDTMLETSVVFAAGMAIILLLRRRSMDDEFVETDEEVVPPNLIIQTTCRLLVPVMQLFALYVVAHGHHSPGGGFQGGVILGATFILVALAFDLKCALRRFPERKNILLSNLGVLIYAGIGALCLVMGGNFLDYGYLAGLMGVTEPQAHSFGILGVEIGVALTVAAVMFSLFADLSSAGNFDEGM